MDARYVFMRSWLPREWVPFDVIDLLFGIKAVDEFLWGQFQAWATRLRRPREVRRPTEVNRHAFESYLQQSGQLPLQLAASHLGMARASFEELLAGLETKGLLPANGLISPQVVSESLIRSFHNLFPKLHYRIFGDHNDYCSRLHAAILTDLGIKVDAIRCETSVRLGEDPPDFAYEHDCLSGAPIGLRYQVWLDFKKPINLRPDACSLRLYAEHEADLHSLVFAGSMPEIPDALKVEHP